MQHSHYDFNGADFLCRVDACRNPASVILHFNHIVRQHLHNNVMRITGHGLIYGVIHNLVDHLVQTRCVLRSNVHAGPLSHGLKTLEGRNFTFVVCMGFSHNVLVGQAAPDY
jgi:hypothetical protein